MTKIIVEESSKQNVPSWVPIGIMSAEQLGGFRLTSRLSWANAVEPFGQTPGHETLYFGTDGDRNDFRLQARMIITRMAVNGLTLETLETVGIEEFFKLVEQYACKHLTGEGHDCSDQDTAVRNMSADPNSKEITVQDYVNIATDTTAKLSTKNILQVDTTAIIEEEIFQTISETIGIIPEADIVSTAVAQTNPGAVVRGEVNLSNAVEEASRKTVQETENFLLSQVVRVLQQERTPTPPPSVADKITDAVSNLINPKSETTPTPTVQVPSGPELLNIKAATQKALGREVTAEEIAKALLKANYDVDKATEILIEGNN